MTKKLTLSIEQDVIETAKHYAEKKGRSLSDLVENYLRTLANKDESKEDVSPRVKRLMGAIELPKNYGYKKSLEEEINKSIEIEKPLFLYECDY